jgi:Zn-dependent membrane protease YugP
MDISLMILSKTRILKMSSIWLVSLIFVGISMLVSMQLKAKFASYGKMHLSANLTGREVAEKMLRDNGIYDVKVTSTNGFLSDHYNPADKTVNLSADVYNGINVAAAAVAAHECGHAVQHANAYKWLALRSALVPVVQFSSMAVQWVLVAGILLVNTFPALLLIGIILFAATTFFSVVTLPVEFDASNRALRWLEGTNLVTRREHDGAKDALKWAAMTYVVAAVASIATLIQYIFIYSNSRRD